MEINLTGRVALVTGAGGGIGAAVARAMAAAGAQVVVAEFDPQTGAAVAAEVGGTFVEVDVANKDQMVGAVHTAIDTYGSIDIVVNNAWASRPVSRLEHKSDADLRGAFEVGFFGPFWAMQAAVADMRSRRWGRIINMVSLNGVNAHMGTLPYNAAKEALRTLTRTAAREWASDGITVNAIAPGAKTPAVTRVMGNNPELLAAADASNPMRRMGDPDQDIAPVAVFLASPGAGYLTGNTLFVDGGSHINGVAWAPDLSASVPASE